MPLGAGSGYEIGNKNNGDLNYDKPFKPACVPAFNIGANLCAQLCGVESTSQTKL